MTEALLAVVLVRMRTSVSVCCVCGSVAVVPVAFLAIMRMRVGVTRGVGACRGVVCVCMLSMPCWKPTSPRKPQPHTILA